jgi:hypothetical protein
MYCNEAEFMNVQFRFVGVSGHNLESSRRRLEVSSTTFTLKTRFKTLLLGGGGGGGFLKLKLFFLF